MLYKNLVDIGLKEYLNSIFSNDEWFSVAYLEKLDIFVAKKDNLQKEILRRKFQPIKDHTSANDHFYELMIALVFHHNGLFQDSQSVISSPDLIDGGICIEVKNINAEPEEIERIKKIVPDTISHGPFPSDLNFKKRFTEKFSYRVDKGKKQINNDGIIYLIWDTAGKGSTKRKPEIDILLNKLSSEEMERNPGVKIITLNFADLRRMVAES